MSSPPSRVIADFTEPLVEGSNLVVYDPCGQQVDNGDSLVASDRLTVTMSGEYEGVYTVNFDVVSAVDSHPTNGAFTFSSGGQPCPGSEPVAQEPEQPSGGGGNAGSSGGGGGADFASSPRSSAGGSDVTRPSAQGAGPGQPGTKDAGQKEDAATGRRPNQNRSRQEPSSAVVPNLNPASASGETETAPSVWEGIPMGVFFVGLALSMVIGAAGGKIYAGIMGWRA